MHNSQPGVFIVSQRASAYFVLVLFTIPLTPVLQCAVANAVLSGVPMLTHATALPRLHYSEHPFCFLR